MAGQHAHQSAASTWAARWGQDFPPAPGAALAAGCWQARFSAGELLDVSVDGRQIIRRLCVRVRDTDWNTVKGVPSRPRMARASHEVNVAFTVRHRDLEGEIDFDWSGRVTGRSDGALEWTMAGRARRAFAYNRIGICVLLNPDLFAGAAYKARLGDHAVSGRIEEMVAPQLIRGRRTFPMFDAFTELEVELDGGLRFRCECIGDVFEMEDQRNWSDGSLKIYSSRVGDPVPRHAECGEEIAQRVRIALSSVDAASARPPFAHRRALHASSVRIILDESRTVPVPPVGVGLDRDRHEPTRRELGWLRRLAPAHLRVDVCAHDIESAERSLRLADQVAIVLGAELEVAISISADQEVQPELVSGLRQLRMPVARMMILDGAAVTGAAEAERARALLPGVPIVCGTDAYFAECNRTRPGLTGVDGLVYPLTPQVHDSDEQAMIESIGGQPATVRTARAFAGSRPIHISPVTLRPRWNPLGQRIARGSAGLPPEADHRQPTTFAAAWTVGSLYRLAAARAASMTYYELSGWCGVMDRERQSIRAQRGIGRPGEPFPVFWVLAEAARLRGRACARADVSDSLSAEVLAVRDGDGLVVLVGNLRPVPLRVALGPLEGDWVAARPLDVLGAGWLDPALLEVRDRLCEVDVAPWSVTRIAAAAAARLRTPS